MRCLIALLSVIVTGMSAMSRDIDIYVAPGGSDRAHGTESAPVATIARALELAQPHCGKSRTTIYLRGGKYRLERAVEIGSEYSGTEQNPLTIMSFPGERAEVSSACSLDCKWRRHEGNILVTEIEVCGNVRFDRLWADGRLCDMARYPNRNDSIAIFGGYASDAIAPERVARWRNPVGGYVHAMHSAEWGGYQYTIEGKSGAGELKLGAGFQNNRMAGMHDRYRMVENVFEELDAPGEWYFDRTKSLLYYIPRQGEEPDKMTFEVAQSEDLFVLRGTREHPVRYVNITGLELAETERTFLKTDEPLLRSDWKIYRGGAVTMENTEYCSLTDCHIHDIGGNAVFFSGYNRHDSVCRNHIEHVGASAVCFVGRPEAVRSPLFEYYEHQPWNDIDTVPGPLSDVYPAYCDATDNLIHSIGEVEKQGSGIQISMARNITVSHNSIYRLPRAGINISEGTWGGHVIEWNDVFDTVLETGDHGSFNSWGRDRYWHPDRPTMDSLAAEHTDAPYLDAVSTTVIRNNRWRCDHGWDIDLDDGSSNYHIYNNLCLNGGLKLREGFRRRVENNIMVNNGFHPHVWFARSGDVFAHNIVAAGYFPIGINEWGEMVDSNYFVSPDDMAVARSRGTDAHSAAGDPCFIAPDKGDYRVDELSGAIAVGFRNFPMDSFGVVHAPLRAIARTPELPRYSPKAVGGERKEDDTCIWHGIRFKTVSTEGERSATGLHAVTGVIVTGVDDTSVGLKANDVVLEVDGSPVGGAASLCSALAESAGRVVTLLVFRNQQSLVTTVDCQPAE